MSVSLRGPSLSQGLCRSWYQLRKALGKIVQLRWRNLPAGILHGRPIIVAQVLLFPLFQNSPCQKQTSRSKLYMYATDPACPCAAGLSIWPGTLWGRGQSCCAEVSWRGFLLDLRSSAGIPQEGAHKSQGRPRQPC